MTDPIDGEKFVLKIHTPYEFTINFNDQYQFFNKNDRHKSCMSNLQLILDKYPIDYWLQPEISMPQYGQRQQGQARFHYHGIIRFPSKSSLIHWLLTTYNSLLKIGRVQLNMYREEWPKYCLKNNNIFKHLKAELRNKTMSNITKKPIIINPLS